MEMSKAFARLYTEHVGDVYGYFAYRFGSRAEAEQLTQATFERAFRERSSFGSESRESRVRLLTIARDAGRGQSAVASANADDLGLGADLGEALERLERLERSVVALRYGGGLASPDIARVLGISEDRARRAQSRGLRRLRTELERPQPAGDAEPESVPARGPAGNQEGGNQEQAEP